jgi:hypothetical protein
MHASVLTCPQCGAPLKPASRFARSTVCSFCNATVQLDPHVVSAARFREAYRRWQSPETYGHAATWAIGGNHFAVRGQLGRGELFDVYAAERARWPSERVIVKVLRERDRVARVDREWQVLDALQRHDSALAQRIPQPLLRGVVSEGPHAGAPALVFRHLVSFRHTLAEVRTAFPNGVEPRIAIWMWRRVLETLTFVHRAGFAHRHVAPEHLLVEDGEHGMLVVGFGRAARVGAADDDSTDDDVRCSARAIASVLGADVPRPLTDLCGAVAARGGEAWSVREQVGELGKQLFGASRFHPLIWPDE